MFGVNVKHIAKGWANDALGRGEQLYKERIAICRTCPLYKSNSMFGPQCDGSKCLDLKTGEVTHIPGKGRVCGCSCYLDKKTRVKEAKCVLNKW